MHPLTALGWGDWQAHALDAIGEVDDVPARVVRQQGTGLWIDTGSERHAATLAGRLKHSVVTAAELPVVGDWVLVAAGSVVHRILPRKTALTRRRTGAKAETQLLAANVDLALIVWALDRTPHLGLLERAVAVAHAGSVRPVIVLTKTDLCPGFAEYVHEVRTRLALDVVPVSVVSEDGIDALAALLAPGRTAALLGQSGAGKSSIVNRLGRAQVTRVGATRGHDHKGKHTTTHRELFRLPQGGLLLDGPGIRELGVSSDPRAVDAAFAEIATLAARCVHRACTHSDERGCAVRAALADGALDARRLTNYLSLLSEARGEGAPHNKSEGRALRRKREQR